MTHNMAHQHPQIGPEWYRDAFGTLYPIVYAHRTVAAAASEAAFAVRETELKPAERVLDLCCGNGRHLFHLVRYTAHATGLDYSPELLAIAAAAVDSDVALVQADMRDIPFVGAFAEALGGIPALVTGPADPTSRSHSEDESVHLDDWRKHIHAEAILLAELAGCPAGSDGSFAV